MCSHIVFAEESSALGNFLKLYIFLDPYNRYFADATYERMSVML